MPTTTKNPSPHTLSFYELTTLPAASVLLITIHALVFEEVVHITVTVKTTTLKKIGHLSRLRTMRKTQLRSIIIFNITLPPPLGFILSVNPITFTKSVIKRLVTLWSEVRTPKLPTFMPSVVLEFTLPSECPMDNIISTQGRKTVNITANT